MTTYSAYLPPSHASGNPQDGFRVIADAKAPFALIFPPFWLAWHRLWLELLVYVAISFAVFWFGSQFPNPATSILSLLPGLYLMLEGSELIRANLERRGWQYSGIIQAANREEAEIRFLLERKEELDYSAPVTPAKSLLRSPMSTKSTSVGLFPE